MTASDIVKALNAYEGDNIWEDVILSSAVPGYDEAATIALDPQGRSDVFVASGVTYRLDARTGTWDAE